MLVLRAFFIQFSNPTRRSSRRLPINQFIHIPVQYSTDCVLLISSSIFLDRLFGELSSRNSDTCSGVGIIPVISKWIRLRNAASLACLEGFNPSRFKTASMCLSRCLELEGMYIFLEFIVGTAVQLTTTNAKARNNTQFRYIIQCVLFMIVSLGLNIKYICNFIF